MTTRRNPTLALFDDRDLIDELVERGLVVEAWATGILDRVAYETAKADLRPHIDEANIQQLVHCEAFTDNLRREQHVDDGGNLVTTHTILILKATEGTSGLTNPR